MTENERNLRAEIERQMEELNRLLDNAIDEVKVAHGLAKMVRTRFETPWRPFPAEKPTASGNYLTTCDLKTRRVVQVLPWSCGSFHTVNEYGAPKTDMNYCVTAWMPFPKPYEKGEPNE